MASAQGKEIWSLATDGSLVHASSKKCLSASGSTDLSPLELAPCDAAGVAKWELQANGQVKMSQSNMCVSQLGSAHAALNIAAAASASASSTLDPSHGAAVAIDGLASTYWVSKMDVAGGVTLLLDLGEAVRGSVLELDFEFVPSAFAVQVASPGAVWRQIFATDSDPTGARSALGYQAGHADCASHIGVSAWAQAVRRSVSESHSPPNAAGFGAVCDSWEKRRRQG